jgi:hypothetical protein
MDVELLGGEQEHVWGRHSTAGRHITLSDSRVEQPVSGWRQTSRNRIGGTGGQALTSESCSVRNPCDLVDDEQSRCSVQHIGAAPQMISSTGSGSGPNSTFPMHEQTRRRDRLSRPLPRPVENYPDIGQDAG